MSAQGVKACPEEFAGPEFELFRTRLWLRENDMWTIIERLTAVSIKESQAQRISTLKNGNSRTNMVDKVSLSKIARYVKSVFGKGLRHVIGARKSKTPRETSVLESTRSPAWNHSPRAGYGSEPNQCNMFRRRQFRIPQWLRYTNQTSSWFGANLKFRDDPVFDFGIN